MVLVSRISLTLYNGMPQSSGTKLRLFRPQHSELYIPQGRRAMIHTQERGTEAWWTETGAEEWADAIVAAMKLGGVEQSLFRLRLGAELLSRGYCQGPGQGPARTAPGDDDPRARGPQCRSGERHGAQPAGGHRGARRRRHLALRRRHSHRLARRLSRADDGRHRAAGLSRLDARRAWAAACSGSRSLGTRARSCASTRRWTTVWSTRTTQG